MDKSIVASATALALVLSSATVVSPSSVSAATGTMASQSTPVFDALPTPFLGSVYRPNTVDVYLRGDGNYGANFAELRLLEDGQLRSAIYRDPVTVKVWGGSSLSLKVDVPSDAPARWNETFEFLVAYTDGSTDRFKQTFTIEPADSIRYSPYLEDMNYPTEQTVVQEIQGLPEGATVELLGTTGEWNVVQLDQRRVQIEVPRVEMHTGDTISLAVQYPDGTGETVDIDVAGWDPDWGMEGEPEPEPEATSSSVPTVTVTEYVPEVSVTTEARTYEVPGPTVTIETTSTETATFTEYFPEPYPEPYPDPYPVYETETVTETKTATFTEYVPEPYPEPYPVYETETATETETVIVTPAEDVKAPAEPVTVTTTAVAAPVTVTEAAAPITKVATVTAMPKAVAATATATVKVTETKEAKVTETVTKTASAAADNGSSLGTGGIIAIVLGLLAALGAGAVAFSGGLPPQLANTLPF